MRHAFWWIVPALIASLSPVAVAQEQSPGAAMAAARRGISLPIVENRGVYPREVRFYATASDRTVFFTAEGVTFRLGGTPPWTVKVELAGRRGGAEPRGASPAEAVVSYFRGPEDEWRTGLPTYHEVVYEEVWPGIDLVYALRGGRLKYDAIVKPEAEPGLVRFRYRGGERVERTAEGGLRIVTPAGPIEERPPRAYQEVDGGRQAVEAAFEVAALDGGDFEVGFRVGEYDRDRPLILDPPILVYCGYLGGVGPERVNAIAVDREGGVYIAGYTGEDEKTFPVTVGPDLTYNGIPGPYGKLLDAFVAKVKADGSGLAYCGYIGGAGWDMGWGIAVDAAGAAYVVGVTGSLETSFPVTVGPDLTQNGASDAFVAKVSPDGRRLEYCGYIGGGIRNNPPNPWVGGDNASAVAVDDSGAAYVTGGTTSDPQVLGFPVTVGPGLTYKANDAFVAKVSPAGDMLLYCGYINGTRTDLPYGIAVDRFGNAYVAGATLSDESSFPVTVGPDLTYNGLQSPFVAKVRADGRGLDYCGYIGIGSVGGVAVDPQGRAYVVGSTAYDETSFPVTVGPDLTFNGQPLRQGDAFIARVSASGTKLEYCGYVGGPGNEWGYGVAVDDSGRAFLCGLTSSPETGFPVRLGPGLVYSGNVDGFVARVNPRGTALEYCGYIGGAAMDWLDVIAVDERGNHAYAAGITWSDEKTLPVRVGPDLTYNGGSDIFLAKVTTTEILASTPAPRVGETVTFSLRDDPDLPYQVGSSFSAGPTPIGWRRIDLGLDNLLVLSVSGQLPWIFSGYAGLLDKNGDAKAAIRLPNEPALVGQQVHTAFVTFAATSPNGVHSVSDAARFRIAAR